jgi:uncharacterized protein YukE
MSSDSPTGTSDSADAGATSDQILADLQELLDQAVVCTNNATTLLDTFDDLDSYSSTLVNSLTTAAKASFEELWANWSKSLVGMAGFLEAVGILLNNGAVHYMNTDAHITKGFGGHADPHTELQKDINKVKENDEKFQKKFSDDEKHVKDVQKQADDDAKYKPETYGDTRVSSETFFGLGPDDKVYRSKKYPGSYYRLDDHNHQDWQGLANQHEQYLPEKK